MSGINYSKDQIEQKRLLALQRKAEKDAKKTATNNSFNQYNSTPGKSGLNLNSPEHNKALSLIQYAYKKDSCGAMRSPKSYNNRPTPIDAKKFFAPVTVLMGTCTMITENRFMVDVEYHQKLIDVFKTIPSKLYDQKTRRWSFHISDYEKLTSKCNALRPEVVLAGIPSYVMKVFKKSLTKQTEVELIDLSPIDSKLTESLMPFQQEGIRYGISKRGRCFIADDMGLGKTIQALGLAHYYRENWPLLIVTPSSVRYQWSEAIFTFLPSVPVQSVHHFTSGKDYIGNSQITIVSYDLLVRSIEVFKRRTYGFVILDESHTVKSGKTARSKAVQVITTNAFHVVLLSGTPALSRPVELYSQISLIMGHSFMGFHDYGIRYCAGEKKSFGWDYSGSSNMQELQLLLRACCLIRRLKSDVLKQLPDKIRQVVILDPTLIKKASEEAKKIAAKLGSSGLGHRDRENAILEYYHESSDQRVLAVCNYVADLLERGQKFLIYAHHQLVLDSICQLLHSKDVQFIRIDGKTLPDQRKASVDLFQESDSCLVAVLSITAANAGITLTAAQLVVFAELFWNPGILCQAEDRVHRIGQSGSVTIQYLVGKNTVDDYLWPLIQHKISVLTKVGLDQNFCLKNAEVSEQKMNEENSLSKSPIEKQTSMDSFVSKCSPNTSQESGLSMNKEKSTDEACENFGNLLDLDEADFADIDFDDVS
ncbi:SWI/SNF-related matrix-associated actin-dependent regulator of chromatin subfamily A-like protein 1 [Venturia canescens]|uniref:SWI/SNF-related matrix-associated actin-dependent regulator of chromatin subfamily A-like protein 1 n=1 Tax=Venturia canescens TaxID=32260 RepID=UPI001C9C92DF|nr:SWI/SNF-related matrix-associated actin-dependent regulator of chromatin subfamily A-like protein 1 [Venturia canescens]